MYHSEEFLLHFVFKKYVLKNSHHIYAILDQLFLVLIIVEYSKLILYRLT